MYRANDVRILGGVENTASFVCPCCSNEVELRAASATFAALAATVLDRLDGGAAEQPLEQ